MPYIQRDSEGKIVALQRECSDSHREHLSSTHPEVLGFLDETGAQTDEQNEFSLTSDLQMVRVIEDVINLLIDKRLILLTDLPAPVQKKLIRQRARREHLLGTLGILGDHDTEQALF